MPKIEHIPLASFIMLNSQVKYKALPASTPLFFDQLEGR
jgi:hypothetical protein